MEYRTVIGLEVHAELNTKTKIYCSCKNAFGGEVNSNCCPICCGFPGTLPTLNKEVVDSCIKMGHALNCKINGITKQDRKHYYYPDLPKAYQISQFDVPLCENGYLDVICDDNGNTKRIGVTRIHIEEDAGKLIHDDAFKGSLVDFNRCGVPLIEIVSEPDMRSSADAKIYLDTIKQILLYLGISDCKMQEGSIRCDVNVSINPIDSDKYGTRVEMKNVNSFGAVCRAIDYEIARQKAVLAQGGALHQETRRWDDMKGENIILRSKEDAQDYRFFPEPDLLTIVVPPEKIEALRLGLPELPQVKTKRYMSEYSLPIFDANLLVENIDRGDLFEETAKLGASPKAAANWLNGDVARILAEQRCELANTKITPPLLADMIALIENKTISNTA
ncbi:MAG: Asp-tRNA(Asn)/Glu-tRNA(Gln) amidotransferase subunit GatB, partial [Oscillospiraceae bacterium]